MIFFYKEIVYISSGVTTAWHWGSCKGRRPAPVQKGAAKSGVHNIPFCQSNGFVDWKHLNPQIQNQENSWKHINNFTKWKLLEKGLEKGGLNDDFAQAALKSEILKWRRTLTIILKCIFFSAVNNFSFRGHEKMEVYFLI